MNTLATSTLLVAVGIAIASPTQAASFINGGFETPDFGTAPSVNYPATIPGWNTTDQSFEIWTSGFEGVPAYEGKQFAELNAFVFGTFRPH